MRVREALPADYGAIMAIHRATGLSERSYEEWSHLRFANPAFAAAPQVPRGWVLEHEDGRIVGTFANVLRRYELDGQPLLAAAASAWGVYREHRRDSLLLVATYFRQAGVDLWINTTANREAGAVFSAMKAARVPAKDYQEILYWITHYPGFCGAALRLKGLGWAAGLRYPLAAAWRPFDALRRANRRGRAVYEIVHLTDFDERFDRFWTQLRQQPGRLLAVRDRTCLQWHYAMPQRQGHLAILAAESGGEMLGYAVLVRRDLAEAGLGRYRLADLQVLDPDPRIVESLVSAAIEVARRRRVPVLEVVGLDDPHREVLARFRPYRRQRKDWPLFYKARSSRLTEALGRSRTWSPTPFDGDGIL